MESTFTAKDFTGFKYKKIIGTSTSVIKLYPELKKYKQFDYKLYKSIKVPCDRIFRYVLLTYTSNILFESIQDMTKRKREAALLAGFSLWKETKTFRTDVENIIKCETPVVNDLIILIIRLNKDSKYQQMLAFEEARANQISDMLNSSGKDATAVLMENVRKLSKYIEELRADLLNQDEQPDIIKLLYENVIQENLGIKPEDIALARKEGNLKTILKPPTR